MGTGHFRKSPLPWRKRWWDKRRSACESAPMRTAAGFFTIPQRPEPSGGAMTGLAATGQGCAGRGRRKSGTPDNQIPSVARCGIESTYAGSAILRPDERQKLVTGLLVVAEGPEHGAGNRLAMLFFHAAHLHAEVTSFDNHANALWSDFLLNRFRDLAGHAFLNLQPPREHID